MRTLVAARALCAVASGASAARAEDRTPGVEALPARRLALRRGRLPRRARRVQARLRARAQPGGALQRRRDAVPAAGLRRRAHDLRALPRRHGAGRRPSRRGGGRPRRAARARRARRASRRSRRGRTSRSTTSRRARRPSSGRCSSASGTARSWPRSAGRPAVTRYVDVATDDNLASRCSCPSRPSPRPRRHARPARGPPTCDTPPASHAGGTLRVPGLDDDGRARRRRRHLRRPRGAANRTILEAAAAPTRRRRDAEPRRDPHEHVLDDGRLLAVGALVIGGTTLLSTLLSGSSSTPTRGSNGTTQVVLGPASARLVTTF